MYHEDGTTVIEFWQLLAPLSPTASLGVEAVPPEKKKPAAKAQYHSGTT
jgi:hypothetical protein